MTRYSLLTFIALFALVFTLAPVCIADDTAKLPAWSPDPTLLKDLGSPVTLLGCQIRPPKGYELTTASQGPSHFWGWSGPAQSNGSRPVFLVGIVVPPDAQDSLGPADQSHIAIVLEKNLQGQQRRMQNWSQTKPEYGTIDDHLFARSYWTGILTRPADGLKLHMHGVDYATIDGKNGILLRAQDMEPIAKADLPVGEAAAQSFRSTGDHGK